MLGIAEEEVMAMYRVVVGILYLSNIEVRAALCIFI
jgi:myosin heavy subunit